MQTVCCYFLPLQPKLIPQYLTANTISLHLSLNVKSKVSHPLKNHNYIYVNYNIIFSGMKLQGQKFRATRY